MILKTTTTVIFSIPEETSMAEAFRKDNPDYLRLELGSGRVAYESASAIFIETKGEKEVNE